MAKKLSYKTKMTISVILDAVDFLLAVPAILAYFTVALAPIAAIFNNVRGAIYDLIAIPISIYFWGPKKSYLTYAELILPEEVDFLLPSVTLSGIIAGKKSK